MKGILAILCVLCLSVLQTNAQSLPNANVQDDYSITLPKTIPVSPAYIIDMSPYNSVMSDPTKANAFLAKFRKPHVTQSFDFTAKELTIHLDLTNASTSNWGHTEWKMILGSYFEIE